ncbi:MAG TPA: ABC transporter permease [Acidimicrobiales bacterium]|nr:ABC transporter permease [Acidimicrobiales bacterium]
MIATYPATPVPTRLRRSHLRPRDVFGVGAVGLRTRRLRTALTALGIAIGIAALVAVLGIAASGRADLLAQLDRLGTNRLTVQAGQSFLGKDSKLPEDATAMIRRIGPVISAAGTTAVKASVRRTDQIPAAETGGISVVATEPELLAAVNGTVRTGSFLNAATAKYPAVVLGSKAAERLGIHSLEGNPVVYLGGRWFSVVGILDPVPLLPNIDSSAMIGYDIAHDMFGTDRNPSTVYVLTDPNQVRQVQTVLAATANPEHPNEVTVSRPSDAFAAKEAVDSALQAVLLGLGGVALLVGGIGIANMMVVAVLERRTEIGVRRALGATKRHIRLQFLVEAVLLALLGGVLGVLLGVAVTAGYTMVEDMVLSVPITTVAAGVGAALVVGAIAGISPAARAARLNPADAVRPA